VSERASHGPAGGAADRRWLLGALALIVAFMVGEIIAGLLADSLALITDAAHLLTDAAALVVAIVASRIVERPARGAYTWGFARVDALSGQANGLTLLLLAAWFVIEAVRRLVNPPDARGGVMVVVAAIGVLVNLAASLLASRADRRSLSVRGAVAHLINDLWAFVATLVAGVVILATGWARADAVASLVVAALMIRSGVGLVRASGRVFLEASPTGVDPQAIGLELARLPGVAEVHDLHVWEIGSGDAAASAHVLVTPPDDCHAVARTLRDWLAAEHGIDHVTLQVDHLAEAGDPTEHCADAHGPTHLGQGFVATRAVPSETHPGS
jgi:cobalt-zinc-cadmium efflux system protein